MNKSKLRFWAYVAGFFLAVSTAIAAYVNSSFLEQFVSERSIGIFYALAASVSMIAAFNSSQLIKWVGHRQTTLWLVVINLIALSSLSFYAGGYLPILFLAVYLVASFLLAINLDLYLERLSDDRVTGRIRGTFLTITNLAWLASPFLSGWLVEHFGFPTIYRVAMVVLLPFSYIALVHFKDVTALGREHLHTSGVLRKIFDPANDRYRALNRILKIDFLLNFFYVVMIVYTPIYLHQHLGFDWSEIGLMFTIMLIPFVLLDIILGWLADRRLGEKEILIAGIAIAGAATLILPWLGPNWLLWTIAFFVTRVGAASIEVMKETYLFKKIDGSDVNIVFVSRNTVPFATIVAPLVTSLFLVFFPFRYIYLLLGLVMFLGLIPAIQLQDTK